MFYEHLKNEKKIGHMEIKLEDIIHFYLGCEVQTKIRVETEQGVPMKKLKGRLIGVDLLIPGKVDIQLENEKYSTDATSLYIKDIKPILRKLITANDEEVIEYKKFQFSQRASPVHHIYVNVDSPQSFQYLLKQSFDLFKLIESGQAIDKTKM